MQSKGLGMNTTGKYALGILGGLAIVSIALVPVILPAIDSEFSPSLFDAERLFANPFAHEARKVILPSDLTYEDSDTNDDGSANDVLRSKVKMLESGKQYLQTVPDYTATITKRELVGQELLDEQKIQIKCRQKPFSVYLCWEEGDVGREVLFIEGTNKGRMIAHDGGWKARIPAISLSPTGSLAMHDTRYPVTKAGLHGLIETMLSIHHEDLRRSNVETCEMNPNGEFDGRPCVVFTTNYKSEELSPEYRKSVTYIDKEWNLATCTRHFEWPCNKQAQPEEQLDEATLIESYEFTNIHMGCHLSDSDFDRRNPAYRFH